MDEIDDVVTRLRRRASRSSDETESLNYKAAADVLERFQRERGGQCAPVEQAPDRLAGTQSAGGAAVSEQAGAVPEAIACPQDAAAASKRSPRGAAMNERALSLKEAAALLGVSYATAYTHREELGFFKIGSAWRIWPDKLREATTRQAAVPPVQDEQGDKPCQSEKSAKVPVCGISISARQAASELDRLLAQPTGKKRRSTTTR